MTGVNKQIIFCAALLLFLASGCSITPTGDIEVDAQLDPNADLSAYKSYAWLGTAQVLHDPRGQWKPPKFDAELELKFLINRELRKRGLVEVTRYPDLAVAFIAGVDMAALELRQDPAKNLQILEEAPRGALVVLFVDTRTRNTVWAGVAQANVQQKELTNKDVRKRMEYAISRMFKLLPDR